MMRKLEELEERFNDSAFDTVLEEDNPWEENENIVEPDFMGVSGKKEVQQKLEIDHEQKIIVNFEKEQWKRAAIDQVEIKAGEESHIDDGEKTVDDESQSKDDNSKEDEGDKKADNNDDHSKQQDQNNFDNIKDQ